MNARVAKRRTRSSRAKLSEACQEKLLDAVGGESEGHSSRSRQQSAASGDLASPVHSRKRQIDAALEIIPVPAKKSRLAPTNSRQLIEVEKAEQAAKTVPQQPKPLPPKRSHASFLEDSVDQPPLSPAPRRYRPESVDSFVTQWVESGSELDCRPDTRLTSESESYRGRHCRSDTLLGHSDDELIPRRLAKSVGAEPNMALARDNDGFTVPPTPPRSHLFRDDSRFDQVDSQAPLYAESAGQSDIAASSGSGRSSGKLVENPLYRSMHLAENNIYLRSSREQYPTHIANLVDSIRRDRDSPGPSLDQVWQDTGLERLQMGTAEPAVENYFKANIFPDPESSDSLYRIDKNPLAKRAVPDVGSDFKVSTPYPDMLYGYNRGAFPQQQTQLRSMGNEMVANTEDLIYPFFVIEFKADGPGGSGSMWVATNQCLGGSASCVNIAERLNRRLKQCKSENVRPIDSAVFSIAMNGTEARLYISWRQNELDYYMRNVKSFLLQEPEQYVDFRKHVLNIIDWGKDKHLKDIRKSLDNLLEEGRKTSEAAAKSRRPPSDGSASSSSRKRRAPSCKGKPTNSKRGRAKGSSPSASDGNPWEWDDERKANKTWDKGLGRWVYWDEEYQAEKYFDGIEWQWVNSPTREQSLQQPGTSS